MTRNCSKLFTVWRFNGHLREWKIASKKLVNTPNVLFIEMRVRVRVWERDRERGGRDRERGGEREIEGEGEREREREIERERKKSDSERQRETNIEKEREREKKVTVRDRERQTERKRERTDKPRHYWITWKDWGDLNPPKLTKVLFEMSMHDCSPIALGGLGQVNQDFVLKLYPWVKKIQ